MIRSIFRHSGVLALLILVALALPRHSGAEPAPAGVSAPKDARALLSAFEKLAGFSARFREQKFLAVLVEPIETEGEIVFTPPHDLVRTTVRPKTRLWVRKGAISYTDAAGKKELPFSKDHPARAFVQVFLDVVKGDIASLETRFDLSYSAAQGGQWTLALLPRKGKGLPGVASIRLRGTGRDLQWMEIVDARGDRTETTFQKSDSSERSPSARSATTR